MSPARVTAEPVKLTSTAYLPYCNKYGRLSRMLAKYNIKSVALPYKKTASYLPPLKDAIGLKHPVFTKFHANAAQSTLDRVGGSSPYALRKMIDT
jgi:hypothetical protein